MRYLGQYIRSFSAPVQSARELERDPPGETTLVVWAFLATALSFLARLGGIITSAQDTDAPSAFIGAQFATSLIFGPLFLYFLAFCSHLIAKLLGGTGTGEGARTALFWSVLLMLPLIFLSEVLKSLAGNSLMNTLFSLGLMSVFLIVWLGILRVFEFRKR